VLATDLNALLRVPGRLCVNPTDLTQAFPYGGTSLGLVRDIVVRPGQKVSRLREENMGVVVMGALNLGRAWSIAAVVRSIDQGQAPFLYPTETGSSSGDAGIVENPLATPPGSSFATVKLLFCPFDELQQFFIYFPAAVLFADEAAELAKSIAKEAGDPLVAWATPRASDGEAALRKKKEDLAL
jgi:hypothetical protein